MLVTSGGPSKVTVKSVGIAGSVETILRLNLRSAETLELLLFYGGEETVESQI